MSDELPTMTFKARMRAGNRVRLEHWDHGKSSDAHGPIYLSRWRAISENGAVLFDIAVPVAREIVDNASDPQGQRLSEEFERLDEVGVDVASLLTDENIAKYTVRQGITFKDWLVQLKARMEN